jgi:CubicO group peptidase (beta-lactamase class C family)
MNSAAIDALLETAVAEAVVPGVVAVVGDRDGTLYEGAVRAQPDTMFYIASMTKALTSVAALQLIERGELELDQSVADVLPAFGELQVLEGFDGDEPRLRPPARQATIRHLFTHTSGAGYWFCNADLVRYHEISGIPDPTAGKRSLFEMPLIADPGTRFEYGISVDWLGLVIEELTGRDLWAQCRETIFEPLNMADATFQPTEEQQARLMPMHFRLPDGGLVPMELQRPEGGPEFWSGGGGGYATARDYMRFMRAILRGGELDGERILRPETVENAFTDHLQGAPFLEVMTSAVPELCNDVQSMPVAQGFGLGFHLVFEDLPGMRRAGSGDWAGLANCFYWIDRASGVAGAFFTQVLPFFDARVVETVFAFETGAYAEVEAPTAA